MMLSRLFASLPTALLLALALSDTSNARIMTRAEVRAKQATFAVSTTVDSPTSTVAKNITFTNPRAKEFYVDGKTIPEVDFDVGPSWAGLLPISSDPDETRKLFFWFFPPGPDGSLDDLIFWTNGGPGCSSLEGFLQENGPISWAWGQAKPTQNEHSWTNLSSVLWVEQPVGTGYSQGEPNIKDEEDLAVQLFGFLQQFLEVFSELKGKNFYLTGESYAGMYVPYITNYIYEHPGILDLNTKGFWIGDPSIGWDVILQEMPAVNFVHEYESVFYLNSTFMAEIDALADRCGYTDYSGKYVTYPPKGPLPLPGNSVAGDDGCRVWNSIFEAALLVNPAFDIYRVFDMYPIPWDVLGFPGSSAQVQIAPVYFDRKDVKEAIHAPINTVWTECSNELVFPNNDSSPPSGVTVLPNIIEKSERSVIIHGLADYVLMAEGTRAVIQNMTWNKMQGFQTPIKQGSLVIDGMGTLGNVHTERNLTYYEIALSGHMVPQFSPKAAFRSMQFLLGLRTSP